jgi:hypothetical protein
MAPWRLCWCCVHCRLCLLGELPALPCLALPCLACLALPCLHASDCSAAGTQQPAALLLSSRTPAAAAAAAALPISPCHPPPHTHTHLRLRQVRVVVHHHVEAAGHKVLHGPQVAVKNAADGEVVVAAPGGGAAHPGQRLGQHCTGKQAGRHPGVCHPGPQRCAAGGVAGLVKGARIQLHVGELEGQPDLLAGGGGEVSGRGEERGCS